MATAHIIHGFLGSGKTTFARKLEKELSALRFTHDEWLARLYGNDPPVDDFPILFDRVSTQIGALWPRCLELGVDVVLDLNFWSRRQRDEAKATAHALGADAKLHRLVCPEEEAWRRVETRNRNLDGSLLIDRRTFEALKNRFEPLGDDEPAAEIECSPE